jgi:predicted DNA-binding transcriptional regulator YafY
MTRPSSSLRAKRLLAILHLFQPNTRIPLDAIADAVGASVPEIVADLESLACCGVAPYTPEALMPVLIEDGYVEVWGDLPALDRAVRLSRTEAHALAGALQAAGLPAGDPLTEKVLAAAGTDVDAADIERVVRAAAPGGPATGSALKTLSLALSEGRAVRIVYRRAGAAEETERTIEPLGLIQERGAWYVEAFCRRAGALRTFRVDRIREAVLAERLGSPRRFSPSGAAFDAAGLPLARLQFAADEVFSEREWPGARVVDIAIDGSTRVDVPYGGTAWLARHVAARLGAVEVLEPVEMRAAVKELALSELERT